MNTPNSLTMAEATEAIELLCPICGLCCNGVLFGSVELSGSEETAPLVRAGLEIAEQAGQQSFAQPCRAFDGSLCHIYAARPARCRKFVCRLLKQAVSGEITLESAMRIITRTKAQALALAGLLDHQQPESAGHALSRRYQHFLQIHAEVLETREFQKEHGPLMMATFQLTQSLQLSFYE